VHKLPANTLPRSGLVERRATPRLEVNGRIHGQLDDTLIPVRVCEIGLGGFSIETKESVDDGLHVVRFTANNRWSISLTAWSRHSRPFCGTDGALRHITGFEFAGQDQLETRDLIKALVDRLESVLNFE
jgi:hypothetical protein